MAEVRLQPLPFKEAIAAIELRGQNPLPSRRWQEVWQDEHAIAFTVARSAGFDILSDVHGSVQKALSEGRTFEQFKAELTPTLQAKGWWGKQVVDGELVQLGSPHRLRTIYDVNMRVSHATGRWEQVQRVKERRPWLRYVAVQDERTRQSHRSWHGTVLPVDDPWWSSHYPPNGWRCRCTVQQLSDRDLQRYGYKPSPNAPPGRTKTWRNPVTGDLVEVPEGIDPGWGHNVGKAREVGAAALAKLADKPPQLAAVAPRAMPDLVPSVTREFGAWLDRVDRRRPRGESRDVGLLSSRVVERLVQARRAPSSAVVTITDREVAHIVRDAKPTAKSLPLDELRRLPEILAAPEAVLLEGDVLIYVFSPGGGSAGRKGKIVVRIGFETKVRVGGERVSVVTNRVRTAGLEDVGSLRDRTRYQLLDGEWP